MQTFAVAVLLLAFSSAPVSDLSTPPRIQYPNPVVTTIESLRSTPSDYFDKRVQVRGISTFGWENSNLWESETALETRQCEKSVGIESDHDLREFNRTKVEIIGLFVPLCGAVREKDSDTMCFNTRYCSDVLIHIQDIKKVND
jgi:hypothetical protein